MVNSVVALKEMTAEFLPILMSQPRRFHDALAASVYSRIDGTDFLRLAYFFSLRHDCLQACIQQVGASGQAAALAQAASAAAEKAVMITHIQVLDRLAQAGIALNYRRLL